MYVPATVAMIAAAGLTFAGMTPSNAASALDESQWGSQGYITQTDSSVSVHWDNSGDAPSADQVSRDAVQVLPHTGGKTYSDLSSALNAGYANEFGANNGAVDADGTGGLMMSVSQTSNLLNQAVVVSFSGVPAAQNLSAFLFQCWGNANEASPDPTHCEEGGVPGTDIDPNDQNLIAADDAVSGQSYMPLTGMDGSDASSISTANTNQESVPLLANQTNQRTFQIDTGAESSFLGCGKRSDAPSTGTCWLVAVPFDVKTLSASKALSNPGSAGPLSPSLWAQRMQVRLSMAPVQAGCPNGQVHTLTAGSELLTQAMQSWIPALCQVDSIDLSYTKMGDEEARGEESANAISVAFTTDPDGDATNTVYAPVAVAGVTFAYVVDNLNTGQQVQQLKLTPQLIVKMLTESYQSGIDGNTESQLAQKAPWASAQPQNIFFDPDFTKLNSLAGGLGGQTGDFIVSNLRSDAVVQLWRWLLADNGPDGAKSFLDGCPDDNGMVINPFFSTRSYAECPTQAATLDKAAQAKIDATTTATGYTYQVETYPPDGTLFPQPSWYARDAINVGTSDEEAPMQLGDLHPHTNDFAATGADVGRAIYPQNTAWCPAVSNPACEVNGQTGMWTSGATPQAFGKRAVFGVTDTTQAALFDAPTAALCDDSGQDCVSASTTTLENAAQEFAPTSTTGVVAAPATPDYAGSAYPLAMPVYAEVSENGLSTSDAHGIATALSFIATTGQTSGTDPGDLPYGYAPLTSQLVAQATTAIAALKAYTPPATGDDPGNPPPPDTSTAVTPPSTDDSTPVSDTVPPPVVPDTTTVPADNQGPTGASPTSAHAATQVQPQLEAAALKTPLTAIGMPRYALLFVLGFAVLAVIVAPVLGSRRRRS